MFVGILLLNITFHKISLKKNPPTMWNFVVLLYQEETVKTERHFWYGIHVENFLKFNLQGAVERYQRNPMGVLENCIGKLPDIELEKEIKRQSEQRIGNYILKDLTSIGYLLCLSFFFSGLTFLENLLCSSSFSLLSFLLFF